jgi:F0F1-type ATP synthase assembly protein I
MLPRNREMGKLMAYGQVGLEMAAPILLGWFLDERFGTLPWLIVAGAVLGLVGGMTHLVMMLNQEERRQRLGK